MLQRPAKSARATRTSPASTTAKVSLVISVIALGSSLIGLYLNVREFRASRTVILTTVTSPAVKEEEDGAKFSLNSVDKDITVQTVDIKLPRLGHEEGLIFEAYAPQLEVDLTVAMFRLWAQLYRTVPKGPASMHFWSCRDWLPAVFNIDYVAKGTRYHQRSLYELHYVSVALEDGQRYGNGAPEITHVRFQRDLEPNESTESVLEEIAAQRHCTWE